jgi:hypothetical protein
MVRFILVLLHWFYIGYTIHLIYDISDHKGIIEVEIKTSFDEVTFLPFWYATRSGLMRSRVNDLGCSGFTGADWHPVGEIRRVVAISNVAKDLKNEDAFFEPIFRYLEESLATVPSCEKSGELL